MAYAVAILLISALTTVGLIAIWAATSTSHWFWRTMGFLAAISPVLAIPAYDLFVAFVIQGAVVAGGVQLAKWRTARKQGEPFFKSQFSLRTVLLAMVPLAVIVAVWVKTPEVGWVGWLNAAAIGLAGGMVALNASRIAHGEKRPGIKWLVAFFVILIVSILVAFCDGFASSIITYPNYLSNDSSFLSRHPGVIWVPVLLLVLVLLVTFLAIFGRPSIGRFRIARFIFGGVLLFFVALPAVVVYFALMNPLPVPTAKLPDPNGHNDFVAAIDLMPARPLVSRNSFYLPTVTQKEKQQASDELQAAFARVRLGLTRPAMIDLGYTEEDLSIDHLGGFRTIARGFRAEGRLLLEKDRPSQAANVFIEGARFGIQLAKGGLLTADLTGKACTGIALEELYISLDQLRVEDMRKALVAIEQLETERDPWEEVLYREKVWSQRAFGWHGHLLELLSDFTEAEPYNSSIYVNARNHELALLRLLRLELALRLWKAEHDGLPKSIDELVPNYISEVPVDPLSLKDEQMKSVRKSERLIIYSVGRNQVDENGMEAEFDNSGYRDQFTGDLRLDILYEPEPSTPTTHPSVTSGQADSE